MLCLSKKEEEGWGGGEGGDGQQEEYAGRSDVRREATSEFRVVVVVEGIGHGG